MRNASAFGSLAQHSGVFALIFVFRLMVMPASHFQTTHVVCGSTTETKKITVQPIPKPKASARNRSGRKFHRQWPMAAQPGKWTAQVKDPVSGATSSLEWEAR